jgi:RNA polymerase sigma-70 factor, ECF subfamily
MTIPWTTLALHESLGHGAAVNDGSRDEALVLLFARLSSGDLDALGEIYDRWAREIHALALWRTRGSVEAADVVQEVFVRLAATRARLATVRDPRRYLLAMAHRAAVDRKRGWRRMVPLRQVAFLEASPLEPERQVDAERASRLLLTLPPSQREALYLRHFSALSFREIGRVTGVPTFTAASRYRLGIRRLRKLMKGAS